MFHCLPHFGKMDREYHCSTFLPWYLPVHFIKIDRSYFYVLIVKEMTHDLYWTYDIILLDIFMGLKTVIHIAISILCCLRIPLEIVLKQNITAFG